jgi:hypothetical protein
MKASTPRQPHYQRNALIIFASLLLCFATPSYGQTVTVDGNIFLLGESQHDSIMVAFERVAPTVMYDMAYTNPSGYFSKEINTGAWNIAYHKNGFLSKYFEAQAIYDDITMPDTVMEVAICGEIKDTLNVGTYIVTCDIYVNYGEKLVLEAGTKILFAEGTQLIVNGELIVNGSVDNEVVFDWLINGDYWKGIKLAGENKTNLIQFASIEHSNNHGLEIVNSTLILSNSKISNNEAIDAKGGGIKSENSELIIKNSELKNNRCRSEKGSINNKGGAIYTNGGNLLLKGSILAENYSYYEGGGICMSNDTTLIENSIFYFNRSSNGSGGVDGSSGHIVIRNTNFIKNRADGYHGGAILYRGGNPVYLYNCNFIENYCQRWGSAIYGANIRFSSNLFWNNVAGWNYTYYDFTNTQMDWFGEIVTTNINEDPIDAYGNLFINPYLTDIANNDFHPSDSSPCINAGPLDTTGLNLPMFDIEGKQRVYGDIIDIGPYEYTGCTLGVLVKAEDISCKGSTDGMAVAQLYGGIEPVYLEWSTGETADTIFGLAPGTYQVTATDAAGCTAVDYFTIAEPDTIQLGLQVFAATCGESNGNAVAFPTGGTAPFNYSWDDNPGNFGLTGIPAGTYHLLVKDKNGCQADSTFYLPGPDSLKVHINKKDLTCYQSDDGFIALHPEGGVAPFEVQWTHGSQGDSIANLAPGVYSYKVTDINECFTEGSILIDEPDQILLSVDLEDATCGTDDGAAIVNVFQGGVAPFTYNWSNGSTERTATSLLAGNYTVKVTDNKGCMATIAAEVKDINAPEILFTDVQHVSCFGLEDGSVNASVNSGTAPFTFTWNTSATTSGITGVAEGEYILTVTDINQCEDTDTIQITQPEKLGAFLSVEHTQCGLSEGVISANVVGGTQPYAFDWSNGSDMAIAFDLPSGTYNVSITDANGCRLLKEETVSDINGPQLEVETSSAAGCNNTDGSVTLVTNGGIAPFTYGWSDGMVTSETVRNDVGSGTYEVTVTDAAGCTGSTSVTVNTRKPEPPSICVVTVDSVTGTNLIVWENTGTPGIEKYKVYKERYIAGSFEPAGEVIAGAGPYFNDEYADPRQRSWKYRITSVDACGNESEESAFHETIHLTINASVNKDVNLIWNNYGGIDAGTYYIHRYARNKGWELIDSVPQSTYENKYTDFNPPVAHLTYYISYMLPGGGCNTSTKKSGMAVIEESISNFQESDVTVGGAELLSGEAGLEVYPNPFRDQLRIVIHETESTEVRIRIVNALGQLVADKELISGQDKTLEAPLNVQGDPGIYFLEVIDSNRKMTMKLVKTD